MVYACACGDWPSGKLPKCHSMKLVVHFQFSRNSFIILNATVNILELRILHKKIADAYQQRLSKQAWAVGKAVSARLLFSVDDSIISCHRLWSLASVLGTHVTL